MNIQQFQYILAVAKFQHFETAADTCNISQSTLSTMIARFEDEIGITIFDRKKKPVEITKEGEKITEQLKHISFEISQLNELVKQIKGEISGDLKIACIPTVAPFLLPLFLLDFSKKFPQLVLEVKENTTVEIIRKLKTGDLDIGIVSTPIQDIELVEYPLYNEPFVLFDSAQELTSPLEINDFKLDNFWLMEEGHCMRSQVLNICENKNITTPLNISFKAGSIDSLIRFVIANKGKTFLPVLAANGLDKKYIKNFKEPSPIRTIGLITHQHFAKRKLINLLKEVILEKISDMKDIEIL